MIERAFLIHAARVYLSEFRARRSSNVNRHFIWTLFHAAQRARRQAQAIKPIIQGELF